MTVIVCGRALPAARDVVSFMEKLRVCLMCAALEVGVLSGVPMRPKEIQELLRLMNQQQLVDVLPEDADGGDGGPPQDR